MNTIQLKSSEMKSIINATFPNNTKRKIYIEAKSEVTFYGLNWDGGSRNQYRACTIDGKPFENKVDVNAPAPWKNQFEGMKITVPQGVVIVLESVSCGQICPLHVYVNPVDMPKYIK